MSSMLSSNHPTRTLANSVAKRSEALLGQSPIKLLSYSRTKGDKGYMLYTNEAFYDYRASSAFPFVGYYLKPGVYDWEDIFPQDLVEGAKSFNIQRAINVILEDEHGDREVVSFYVESGSTLSKSIFLSNVEWLKSIILQFRESASDLLAQVEAQAIEVPQHFRQAPEAYNDLELNVQNKKRKTLYKKLSTRERDCLDALMMGLEVREIAKRLNIRPTSVYTYINRVKQKIGCTKQNTLFKFARQRGWDNITL